MTIRATLALASPMNESGPVCSAMTPTLMGRWTAPGFLESAMISSFGKSPADDREPTRRGVWVHDAPPGRPLNRENTLF